MSSLLKCRGGDHKTSVIVKIRISPTKPIKLTYPHTILTITSHLCIFCLCVCFLLVYFCFFPLLLLQVETCLLYLSLVAESGWLHKSTSFPQHSHTHTHTHTHTRNLFHALPLPLLPTPTPYLQTSSGSNCCYNNDNMTMTGASQPASSVFDKWLTTLTQIQ